MFQRFIERSLETLFVEAEVDEGFQVVAEDAGGGEGSVDLGMFCLDPACGFEMTEGEHGVFDRPGPVEAPLGVAEGLGVLALERGLGREAFEESFAEEVVSVHVFVRHDDRAAGQAVARGVHGRALFAFFGAGTGGFRFRFCNGRW